MKTVLIITLVVALIMTIYCAWIDINYYYPDFFDRFTFLKDDKNKDNTAKKDYNGASAVFCPETAANAALSGSYV